MLLLLNFLGLASIPGRYAPRFTEKKSPQRTVRSIPPAATTIIEIGQMVILRGSFYRDPGRPITAIAAAALFDEGGSDVNASVTNGLEAKALAVVLQPAVVVQVVSLLAPVTKPQVVGSNLKPDRVSMKATWMPLDRALGRLNSHD